MSRSRTPSAALLAPSALCLALLAACSTGDNNTAPQAGDDRFAINNGQSIDLPPNRLLANDSDPDGDPLRLVGATTPVHGTLTPLADGGYRYTNDGSNSTTDWFEYQIEDDNGGRASAVVTIGITPGPTANDDSRRTDEDTPVIIDVTANDTTVNNGPVTISSNDGSGITITTGPGNGTAEVVSGKVQYTPEADFYGRDSFTYTIKDSSGIPSNPATVTITVTPVNDPPQANDDTATTPEDTVVTILVLDNDADIDDGINPASVTILSGPANGSAVINDGKITYTPNNGFNGSDTLTYRLRDTGGLWSEPATVTITITPVNDGAPVAVNDEVVTGKNQPVTIDILANDSDPDGNGTIDRNAISVTQPSYGSVTVNRTTGEITYTPDSGFSGFDSFTYRLRDEGRLWSNVAGVTIRVNTAPTAVGNCSPAKQEKRLTGRLDAIDPDQGETLTFSLGTHGSWDTGPMPTVNGGSVKIIDPNAGTYEYTPNPANNSRGRDSFDFLVTDSAGATATATETIIVATRIMPLGDSITSGVEDHIQADELDEGYSIPPLANRKGYRQPLYQRLIADGYEFDFVGSRNDGVDVTPAYDSDAEGWPGYTALEIVEGRPGETAYTGIYDALNDNPADIILLHIGTNDITTTDVNEIADILDEIDRWEQQSGNNRVTVVLAKIIDQWHWKQDGHPNNTTNPAVTALNQEIQSMVADRISRLNDDIILVDMQSALDYPADLGDRGRKSWHYWLHPNTIGYQKMAEVWRNALTGLLDRCP